MTMKIFADTVHRQISIPKRYCERVIDTKLFQRLKRIEQTYASSIFPTATHNRFVHSLGVYHVGCLLLDAIEKYDNAHSKELQEIINSQETGKYIFCSSHEAAYEVLKESFKLACLLHDCGHAPFSHTFEDKYTCTKDSCDKIEQNIKAAAKYLTDYVQVNSTSSDRYNHFFRDFDEDRKTNSYRIKPHEIVSAWLTLKKEAFGEAISRQGLYADPLLIARMIMGIPFSRDSSDCKNVVQILNCYISLLNGHLIDADRIDYASRDQWATGVASSNLNLMRLLSSIRIEKNQEDDYVISYNKKAWTELEALTESKNFSNYWIFNHHKFKLLEDELKKSVTCLAVLLSGKQSEYDTIAATEQNENLDEYDIDSQKTNIENQSLANLFDYENMLNQKKYSFSLNGVRQEESIIYPCDDDIIYLLKKYFSVSNSDSALLQEGNKSCEAWFTRAKNYIPVWKSQIEYEKVFLERLRSQIHNLGFTEEEKEKLECLLYNSGSGSLKAIQSFFVYIVRKALNQNANTEDKSEICRIIEVEQSTFQGMKKLADDVYVHIVDCFVKFSELETLHKQKETGKKHYFYLYIPASLLNMQSSSATTSEAQKIVLRGIGDSTIDDIKKYLL